MGWLWVDQANPNSDAVCAKVIQANINRVSIELSGRNIIDYFWNDAAESVARRRFAA